MPGMWFGSMSYPPVIGAHPPDLLRIWPLESRMLGNSHVRFGGGRMEKGVFDVRRRPPTRPSSRRRGRTNVARGVSPLLPPIAPPGLSEQTLRPRTTSQFPESSTAIKRPGRRLGDQAGRLTGVGRAPAGP
jgi:hypothetical protein